jgi:hypothetical protein
MNVAQRPDTTVVRDAARESTRSPADEPSIESLLQGLGRRAPLVEFFSIASGMGTRLESSQISLSLSCSPAI